MQAPGLQHRHTTCLGGTHQEAATTPHGAGGEGELEGEDPILAGAGEVL